MTSDCDIELEGKQWKCKTCYNARLDALFGWSPCQNAGCAYHPKNHDGYFPQYQNREEMEKEFDHRVQYLDHAFLGKVSFKVIGPLPLYSFKCIEIEWANAKEVREALTFLDLKEDATLADLRSAYYQKAKSIHPDKTGESLNSPSEFEKVVKAFHLLDRCYRTYSSLPSGERILLMEVKTKGANDGGKG